MKSLTLILTTSPLYVFPKPLPFIETDHDTISVGTIARTALQPA